jgi:dolichol kinase
MPPTDPDFEALVSRTGGLQPLRRIFHALSGLVMALVPGLLALSPAQTAALLFLGFLLALTVDLLRLRSTVLNRAFFRTFRFLASPREAAGMASSTWYLLGGALVWTLFPPAHAVSGLLVLALADPVASVVGRIWGTSPLGKGSVQGSLAFFASAWLVLAYMTGRPLAAAVVAGGVAVVEILPGLVDDNLAVPLSTGVLLWLVLGVPPTA